MSFAKAFTMDRMDNKETKGCFRYGVVSGQLGVQTIYLRKEHTDGVPPKTIRVTIEEAV